MTAAYPNITSLSLRKCVAKISRPEDVGWILRGAQRGGGGETISSVDLEGCDAAVSDADIPALLDAFSPLTALTDVALGKCPRLTDKGIAAVAAHPMAASLEDISVAGCAPGITAAGLAALTSGKAGAWPKLRRLDVSGCTGIKGSVALPPRLTVSSLRAMYLPALTALTVLLPAAAPLEQLLVSECRSLKSLSVSSKRLKLLNAAGCKQLTHLELHCAGLDTLILQHCSHLAAPIAFICPGLRSELIVNGCTSLTTSALSAMVNGSPELCRLRADGCASLDGDLVLSSRALREVSVEGCARLDGLRVAAPLQALSARACRNLTAVWLYDIVTDGVLRVDVRNCSLLKRLVGVRAAALEGRLSLDMAGCTSLLKCDDNDS